MSFKFHTGKRSNKKPPLIDFTSRAEVWIYKISQKILTVNFYETLVDLGSLSKKQN